MASWLIVSRYILIALFLSFDAILCCISIWNFSTIKLALHIKFNVDVYVIFTSAFSFFFVFPILLIDFFYKEAYTSRIAVELAWVSILFVMQLAGAAAFTSESPRVLCNNPSRPNILDVCTSSQVVIAFAWLSTITLLIYLIILSTSTLLHAYSYPAYRMPLYVDSPTHGPIQRPCYADSIWRTGVREFPWFRYRNMSASTAVRNGPTMSMTHSWDGYQIGGRVSAGGNRAHHHHEGSSYQFGQFSRAAANRLSSHTLGQGSSSNAGRMRLNSTDDDGDAANQPWLPSLQAQAQTIASSQPRSVSPLTPQPRKHKLRPKEDRRSRSSFDRDPSTGLPPMLSKMSRTNFEDVAVPIKPLPNSAVNIGSSGSGQAIQERKHSQELNRPPPVAPSSFSPRPRRFSIANPDPTNPFSPASPSGPSFQRPDPALVVDRSSSETFAIPDHPYSLGNEPSTPANRYIVPPSELSRAIMPGSLSHPYAAAASGKQPRPLPQAPTASSSQNPLEDKKRLREEEKKRARRASKEQRERQRREEEDEMRRKERRRIRHEQRQKEKEKEKEVLERRKREHRPTPSNTSSHLLTQDALAEHTQRSVRRNNSATVEYVERTRLERSSRRVPVPEVDGLGIRIRGPLGPISGTFGAPSGEISFSPIPSRSNSNARERRSKDGDSSRKQTLLS